MIREKIKVTILQQRYGKQELVTLLVPKPKPRKKWKKRK